MKHILILFLSLVIIFPSCDENEDDNVKGRFIQFEIKNESDKEVTIFLYRRNNDLFRNLKLNSGDSSILDEGTIGKAPRLPTYSLTMSIDSAIIVFSNNKKLTQTFKDRGNNDTINNILNIFFYYNVNGKLRFTLKQSDYLRAK